jgi:hypothetical protein
MFRGSEVDVSGAGSRIMACFCISGVNPSEYLTSVPDISLDQNPLISAMRLGANANLIFQTLPSITVNKVVLVLNYLSTTP